jgi:putative multiple sugar transport system permease protein
METKNKKIVNMDLKQYGMFLILIGIFILFAITTNGANAKPVNINNLIMQNGYVVILAIGMLLCVLTGNIDLGVGSVVAVTGSVAGIIVAIIIIAVLTGSAATDIAAVFLFIGSPAVPTVFEAAVVVMIVISLAVYESAQPVYIFVIQSDITVH